MTSTTESPFLFGRAVSERVFVNREEEIKRISANLKSGINTMLISPRRWGKSSLVREVARRLSGDKKVVFCFIDMFSLQSEEEFYEALSREVLKSTSSKVEDWVKNAKEFFGALVPRISLGIDPQHDLSISFDKKELKKHRADILDLPERVATAKRIRLVICLDEFQSLRNFKEPDSFERLLRSVWQHQKNTVYCLYGSKRHMMSDLFQHKNRPFYHFGDVMLLEKIAREHWVEFIRKRFEESKKEISAELAGEIASKMKNHSYYTQQLSHLVWVLTVKKATAHEVDAAIKQLLDFNEIYFQREIEGLSNTQINFIKAVLSGVTQFTSMDAMNTYELGSPRNVSKNRQILEQSDIVDARKGSIELLDPAFELWLRKYFFRIPR